MSRRLALGALSLALLLGSLAACTDVPRIPPPEPAATSTPLFATDEEALEAATAAYEEYLAAVDTALQNPEPLLFPFTEVAAGSALDEAQESLASFVDEGLRFTGNRIVTNSSLMQRTNMDDLVEIQIYVCESVELVDVLDAQGNSLVEAGRPNLTSFEVTVIATLEETLVWERLVWSGGGVCNV